MNSINNTPIWVDFNNCEKDQAVRLHLPGTVKDIRKSGINLAEAKIIWITDGEIEEMGTLEFRDGIWVAVPIKGTLKNVDKSAPYHIK